MATRPAPTSAALPLQQEVVDRRRLLTVPWTSFFDSALKAIGKAYAEGTHEDRAPTDGSAAATGRPGSLYWETDRTVMYQMRLVEGELTWVYLAGTMRAELAAIPTDLHEADTGFLFYATDYIRTWRWTGTAWEYAPGERLEKEILWYPGTAAPAGWAECNGTSVTVTTPEASVASFLTPSLVGHYPKGGVYTGTSDPSVPPTLTGETGPETGHTHVYDPPMWSMDVPTTTATVQSGAGATVAGSGHQHYFDLPASTTGTGSAHSHGVGTLSIGAQAEPSHVLMLPIIKL